MFVFVPLCLICSVMFDIYMYLVWNDVLWHQWSSGVQVLYPSFNFALKSYFFIFCQNVDLSTFWPRSPRGEVRVRLTEVRTLVWHLGVTRGLVPWSLDLPTSCAYRRQVTSRPSARFWVAERRRCEAVPFDGRFRSNAVTTQSRCLIHTLLCSILAGWTSLINVALRTNATSDSTPTRYASW